MISRELDRGRSRLPPEAPAQAAAYWSARRQLGTMDAKDEAAFARWMETPAHRDAMQASEGVVDRLGLLAADAEIRRMREATLSAYPVRPRRRWTGWAAAAAVVGLLAIGVWMGRVPEPVLVPVLASTDTAPASTVATVNVDGVPAPVPAALQIGAQRYHTEVGQRRDLRLPDGTVIALNTASTVLVNYTHHKRNVQLLQGQALFEVAPDADRPFVVTAGDRRITAVGTAFDVRVDASGLRVSMVEGKVKVDPIHGVGLDGWIPLLGRKRLEAGEQLVSNAQQKVTVSVTDVDREVSWREGRLIFRHDTLAEAVAEINRYSRTQLVVEDPRAADLRISGVFSTSRPENFVSALGAYYPIEARARAPRVIGLGWRESPDVDAEAPR